MKGNVGLMEVPDDLSQYSIPEDMVVCQGCLEIVFQVREEE